MPAMTLSRRSAARGVPTFAEATRKVFALRRGGWRNRMRWHSARHRALVFRGRRGRKGEPGEEWLFEVHTDNGRTYTLMLDAGDVDALQAAGLVRTVAAVLDERAGRGV